MRVKPRSEISTPGSFAHPQGAVTRSTYCLGRQAGLPTGPVGNHAIATSLSESGSPVRRRSGRPGEAAGLHAPSAQLAPGSAAGVIRGGRGRLGGRGNSDRRRDLGPTAARLGPRPGRLPGDVPRAAACRRWIGGNCHRAPQLRPPMSAFKLGHPVPRILSFRANDSCTSFQHLILPSFFRPVASATDLGPVSPSARGAGTQPPALDLLQGAEPVSAWPILTSSRAGERLAYFAAPTPSSTWPALVALSPSPPQRLA